MTRIQANLIRYAQQHGFHAYPHPTNEQDIRIVIPYTHATEPDGEDIIDVHGLTQLRIALGY
jgi:hypothetical protein